MLAKLTSKNQLTLPNAVLSDFPKSDYFEVTREMDASYLTPVRLARADAVRAELAEPRHFRGRGGRRRHMGSPGGVIRFRLVLDTYYAEPKAANLCAA